MEETHRKEEKNNDWLKITGIILIFVSIVLLCHFSLRGHTSVSGKYPGSIYNNSLTCNADNSTYFVFKDEDPINTTVQINIIFNDKSIDSMSLIYIAYYKNNILAEQALARMHAKMNFNFGADLGPDAFNANYAVNSNGARMSLYASNKNLKSERERNYFLLTNYSDSIDQYIDNYERQNFDCQINKQ